MAPIVPDPRRIKSFRTETAFEAWLAPANFEGTGQQHTRLSALTGPILMQRG